MQRNLLPSTSTLLSVCLLSGANLLATDQLTGCEAIRAAIRDGDYRHFSTASSCADTSEPRLQADLIDMAIQYRQSEIAIALVRQSGTDIITPALMHNATLFEHPQVVRAFLEAKPELLEARNDAGVTPLTSAALGRAYMAAKVLLENGARDEDGQSLVVAVGRSREIAYLIMQRHDDWLADASVTGDVLGNAIQYTDEAFLQYLLSLGAEPNLRDSRGNPVILHATRHESEREGERNWFFMANHGANELEAVCSIESSHLQGIEENAPRWFASKVTELRPLCTDSP